jgi:hypothetical protein
MARERLAGGCGVDVEILHSGVDRGGSAAIVQRGTDDVGGKGGLERARGGKGFAGRRRGGLGGAVVVVVIVISVLVRAALAAAFRDLFGWRLLLEVLGLPYPGSMGVVGTAVVETGDGLWGKAVIETLGGIHVLETEWIGAQGGCEVLCAGRLDLFAIGIVVCLLLLLMGHCGLLLGTG